MKPCPFCGSTQTAVSDCSPGIYRVVCGGCDAIGAPGRSPAIACKRWQVRSVQPSREMTATEVAAKAAEARTREQADLRHARAIADLYDDGGER